MYTLASLRSMLTRWLGCWTEHPTALPMPPRAATAGGTAPPPVPTPRPLPVSNLIAPPPGWGSPESHLSPNDGSAVRSPDGGRDNPSVVRHYERDVRYLESRSPA